MQYDRSPYRKGETITTTASGMLQPGQVITIFRPSASGGFNLMRVLDVAASAQQVTIRRMNLMQRLWYYITHPGLWKFALDIPFNPPEARGLRG